MADELKSSESYAKLGAYSVLGAVLVGVPFFLLGGVADPFFAAPEVSAATVGAAGAVSGFALGFVKALG